MSDVNVEVAEAEKPLSVDEKLEILNAQLGFVLQAVAELDQQVTQLGNFLNMVFSLTAQKPQEESEVDQPQS